MTKQEENKAYREKHGDRLRAYSKNYYKENKEVMLAQAKEHYSKNKESILENKRPLTAQEKLKKAEYSKNYYKEHRVKWTSVPQEVRNERMREWRAKHPEANGSGYFRNKQLEVLAGRPKPAICELCGDGNSKICFDHDHSTGKFRGWICLHCNSALGYARDNPELLYKFIDYLNQSRGLSVISRAQVPLEAGVAQS